MTHVRGAARLAANDTICEGRRARGTPPFQARVRAWRGTTVTVTFAVAGGRYRITLRGTTGADGWAGWCLPLRYVPASAINATLSVSVGTGRHTVTRRADLTLRRDYTLVLRHRVAGITVNKLAIVADLREIPRGRPTRLATIRHPRARHKGANVQRHPCPIRFAG